MKAGRCTREAAVPSPGKTIKRGAPLFLYTKTPSVLVGSERGARLGAAGAFGGDVRAFSRRERIEQGPVSVYVNAARRSGSAPGAKHVPAEGAMLPREHAARRCFCILKRRRGAGVGRSRGRRPISLSYRTRSAGPGGGPKGEGDFCILKRRSGERMELRPASPGSCARRGWEFSCTGIPEGRGARRRPPPVSLLPRRTSPTLPGARSHPWQQEDRGRFVEAREGAAAPVPMRSAVREASPQAS